ncbi:hypothetical protein [Streptomyces sp. CoH17]|uniref:hypothetical protein n=1 Tax=Streptomyces sp. CoH17 TaxID=2992806 RepID=UPI00226EC18C|nr:hypothetical protein [Streptomyces sp. CoH17]
MPGFGSSEVQPLSPFDETVEFNVLQSGTPRTIQYGQRRGKLAWHLWFEQNESGRTEKLTAQKIVAGLKKGGELRYPGRVVLSGLDWMDKEKYRGLFTMLANWAVEVDVRTNGCSPSEFWPFDLCSYVVRLPASNTTLHEMSEFLKEHATDFRQTDTVIFRVRTREELEECVHAYRDYADLVRRKFVGWDRRPEFSVELPGVHSMVGERWLTETEVDWTYLSSGT